MDAALIAFCEALAETPLSAGIRDVGWIIPLVQTVHILGIAAVVGSAGLIHLRLLGLAARSQTVFDMGRRLLPGVWAALAVLLTTGAILAIGEPVRSLANPAFQLKMLMLLAAVGLTVLFQRGLRKDALFWEASAERRLQSRLIAGLSLLLWIGIIFAGRWIAYIDPGAA